MLLLLDEFQNLGRLGPVERDVSLPSGFGVQFWLFVQDISRLRAAYPHTWETFFTNSDVLQAFGASNDRTTSEYLSWLTGEAIGEAGSAPLAELDSDQRVEVELEAPPAR